ncbi:hypothetical protein EXIGLDRAFT_723687 [Exidia glandulosa HHB12029]|uniref:DUF6699 domain-containing protein n=1 Tax=Exidia glandulosa HHB12029 TaxID=1314781 RepID=A0A165EQC2_EXIGL|nr:hypothetical protein EXIGLDRAFT_723687 [Exidia glandulosa HHB12029]
MTQRPDTYGYGYGTRSGTRPHYPYTPAFQPPYRYPIALPRAPRAGDAYWPRPLPPTVYHPTAGYLSAAYAPQPTAPDKSKHVRFSLPSRLRRSRTMPDLSAAYAQASTSAVPQAPERSRYMTRPPPAPSTRTEHRQPGTIPVPSVSLAPILAAHPPVLHFNLAFSSSYARLSTSSTPLSSSHRHALATSPPTSRLRIRSQMFPWPIEIVESAPRAGVRVGNVLDGLSKGLWYPLSAHEYASLDARNKSKIDAAYQTRVGRTPGAAKQGILRLDWLQGHTMFQGLAPTRESGTWALMLGWPTT